MRNLMAGSNYERLTPRERLVLLTDAKARADEGEIKRLYDTAPMQTWRIMDHEFIRGRDALWDLVHVVCMFLNENVGKLQIIDKMQRMTAPIMNMATLETVPKILDAVGEDADERAARGLLDSSRRNREDNEQPISKAEWTQIIDGLTSDARQTVGGIVQGLSDAVTGETAVILASFDRLTRRVLDMDALTVLRAWAPPIAEALANLSIIDHAPDAESVDLWAQVWANGWNMRMGIRTAPEQTNCDGKQTDT